MGEKEFQSDMHLKKVVSTIHLVAINISLPVRMTPCSHRLQLQTLWTGKILTGKIIVYGDKCLARVVHTVVICSLGNLLSRFHCLHVASRPVIFKGYTITIGLD